jgi:hypothetical protein
MIQVVLCFSGISRIQVLYKPEPSWLPAPPTYMPKIIKLQWAWNKTFSQIFVSWPTCTSIGFNLCYPSQNIPSYLHKWCILNHLRSLIQQSENWERAKHHHIHLEIPTMSVFHGTETPKQTWKTIQITLYLIVTFPWRKLVFGTFVSHLLLISEPTLTARISETRDKC